MSENVTKQGSRKVLSEENVAGKRQAALKEETGSPQSVHVITSPLNWCQGASAAVTPIKCSWRYERSAGPITSRITTQKPASAWRLGHMLTIQRADSDFPRSLC